MSFYLPVVRPVPSTLPAPSARETRRIESVLSDTVPPDSTTLAALVSAAGVYLAAPRVPTGLRLSRSVASALGRAGATAEARCRRDARRGR